MEGPRGKEFEVDRERSTFDILLPPGLHTLNATSSSGEGSVTFQVLDFDIENLAVPTTPTFDISGHISLEGESNAAALGNARITLRRDPPTEPSSGRFSYSSPLPNGSFVVGASSGDYRLNIELPPGLQNAYVKSVRLGNTDVLNGPLHFDGKPSAQFEVVIGKNPGAIDGQVVADRQTSVADVSVVLVPDNRRRTELYRATTTDLSGQFHFDRVPPGNYRVFSWEDVVDGAWYDPEFLRTNENRGTPIRVIDGRSENVRINVIP